MYFLAIGLLIVSIVLYAITGEGDTIAGLPREDFPRLAAPLSILIMVAASYARSSQGKAAEALKALGAWFAVGLVMVVIYVYRAELSDMSERVAGELQPGSVQTISSSEDGRNVVVKIRKGSDGHFIAKATINNQNIRMIVDTGASTVVLRPEDAERVGIHLRDLHYTIPVETANGRAMAARIKLTRVYLDKLYIEEVDALVTRKGALQQSLLGMSFLSRLQSYEFSKNQLTLKS